MQKEASMVYCDLLLASVTWGVTSSLNDRDSECVQCKLHVVHRLLHVNQHTGVCYSAKTRNYTRGTAFT